LETALDAWCLQFLWRLELGIWSFVHYNTARPMLKPTSEKPDLHSEEFLHALMRKQLKLSVACALAFLVVLLGLPLANYFAPELMATRVLGGFTLTWFLLGLGFFPAVWCIAFYFIRRSIKLEEEEEVAEVVGEKHQTPKPKHQTNPNPPAPKGGGLVSLLLFGIWNFLGVWCFGVWVLVSGV
jgi:uncharacterized membrane protein (DUF485 family)